MCLCRYISISPRSNAIARVLFHKNAHSMSHVLSDSLQWWNFPSHRIINQNMKRHQIDHAFTCSQLKTFNARFSTALVLSLFRHRPKMVFTLHVTSNVCLSPNAQWTRLLRGSGLRVINYHEFNLLLICTGISNGPSSSPLPDNGLHLPGNLTPNIHHLSPNGKTQKSFSRMLCGCYV